MALRFCKQCQNMLYPRENKQLKVLEYACQPPCKYSEQTRELEEQCVYRNYLIKDTATKLEVIPSEINKDPTLGRSTDRECPACGHKEAVQFLADPSTNSVKLALIYVCCKSDCGHKWMPDLKATE